MEIVYFGEEEHILRAVLFKRERYERDRVTDHFAGIVLLHTSIFSV